MDVFEDLFLGLFNQFENVAVKVMAINKGRTFGAQKDRASKLKRFIAEKKPGRIEQLVCIDQSQFGQGILWCIPGELGSFHEVLDFGRGHRSARENFPG